MMNNDALVVPFFKAVAQHDEIASKKQGRPIFHDLEVVEVRIAGDRNFAPVFPAKSMWRRVDGEALTYADRWPDQYARFKANQEQVASGTPLSELPFLTEAQRATLRSCKVYTAEALSAVDGKELRNLGPAGREMQAQATAYLLAAGGSAQTIALAAEVATLKAQLAAFQGVEDDPTDEGAELDALKVEYAGIHGHRPKGNPSVATLREMIAESKVA